MEHRTYEAFLELLKNMKVKSVALEVYDPREQAHQALVRLKNGSRFRMLILATSIPTLTESCYHYRVQIFFRKPNALSIFWRSLWLPIFWGSIACLSSVLGTILAMIVLGTLAPLPEPSQAASSIPHFIAMAEKNEKKPGVEAISFEDVILDQELRRELLEIGEYLHSPKKFEAMGVTPPKGLLLTGPPGTGKTLLAKALANSLSANFIALKGPDFQTKWVGEGAQKVRELFQYARKHSPCLIYIDEIDALGLNREAYRNSRGSSWHTLSLNQFLIELDGFRERDGIFVIASTNRPEMLDPALLRPGRLERTLRFGLPTREQREKILLQAAERRKIPLQDPDVCAEFAKITTGWSGAKLVNLLNEASIEAARSAKKLIDADDFRAAFWRIEMGSRHPSSATEEVKRSVAIHEAGHLLCKWVLSHTSFAKQISERSDEITYQVSILPTNSGALGFVAHTFPVDLAILPEKWNFEMNIIVSLGGREAENLFYPTDSNNLGASSDYARAKALILQYIASGFSENSKMFYGNCAELLNASASSGSLMRQAEYSSLLRETLQKEVDAIWKESQTQCSNLLKKNKAVLEKLANLILEKETLHQEDIIAFFEKNPTTA